MAATAQKWTLKVEFEGEVRRLRDWPEHQAELSAESLRTAISGLFELTPDQRESLVIKYQDDEGDMCTLVEASMADVFAFASQQAVLRFMASCGPSTPMPTASAAAQHLNKQTSMLGSDTPAQETALQTEEESAPTEVEASATPVDAEAAQDDNLADAPHTTQSGNLGDVRCEVVDKLNEARRVVSERFDNAQPHLKQGFAHFKQQVVDDFQSTSKDMKDAFGPSEAGSKALGLVRGAAGMGAGIVAAARLAPIRATRLAACSAAAVAGRDLTSFSAAPTESCERAPMAGSVTEFSRLKQQVKGDFLTTQKDVSTAIHCILGPETDSSPSCQMPSSEQSGAEQDDTQTQRESTQETLKARVPQVVSTVVGVSAAVCLLPVRGATFAVANFANVLTKRSAEEDEQRQEPVSDEAQVQAP
jgi:hypothetical protein